MSAHKIPTKMCNFVKETFLLNYSAIVDSMGSFHSSLLDTQPDLLAMSLLLLMTLLVSIGVKVK